MSSQVRALYAACERVPGPTASGTRLAQLVLGFSPHLEGDGLSLKSEDLAHIQKLGTSRMMRVPSPEGGLVERAGAFQRALKRQLEGDAYDLVHVTDAWAGAVAAQHKESQEIFLVSEVLELPTQSLAERAPQTAGDERIKNVVRRGEQLVLTRSDALVVPGQAAKNALIQAGGQADKIHIIPHGVDETVFFASSIELRLHDGFTVAYAGAAVPGRGLNTFLQALRTLPPNMRGVLLRQHPKEKEAEEQVALFGLQDRIIWQDAATPQKLASVFQSVDVVVLLPQPAPGTVHGAMPPRRILEAMLCKRPVIASDTEGVREILQDRQTGLLVTPKDPRSLASSIHVLHADVALRARMGAQAASAASQFTWPDRLVQYARLYEQLLEVPFSVPEPKKGRQGGLADRLKASRAAAPNPGVGIMRDERAARGAASPASQRPAEVPMASASSSPPVAAPEPVKAPPAPVFASGPAAPVFSSAPPPSVQVGAAPASVVLGPEPTKPTAPYFPAAAFTPSMAMRPPSGIMQSVASQQTAPFPTVLSGPSLPTAPPVQALPVAPGQPLQAAPPKPFSTPAEVTIPGVRPPVMPPPGGPAFLFGHTVTSPDLVVAPVPERWGFENPATMLDGRGAPLRDDGLPPSVRGTPLQATNIKGTPLDPMRNVVGAPVPAVSPFASGTMPSFLGDSSPRGGGDNSSPRFQPIPSFLGEPTGPGTDSVPRSPLAAAPEPHDPWGGDTVAVDQPPMPELQPPAPPPEAPMRGPVGMRSLSLLDSVDQPPAVAPVRHGPSPDETERLDLNVHGARPRMLDANGRPLEDSDTNRKPVA